MVRLNPQALNLFVANYILLILHQMLKFGEMPFISTPVS